MPRVIVGWLDCPPITLALSTELGEKNLDADGLSRKPHDKPEDDTVFIEECQRIDKFRSHLLSSVKDVELQLQSDTVMAACQRHMALDQTGPSCSVAIPDMFQEEGNDNNLLALPRYTHVRYLTTS